MEDEACPEGLRSGSDLATERRGSGSACEPVDKQALETESYPLVSPFQRPSNSCSAEGALTPGQRRHGLRPNLLIPSSVSSKVVVSGILGDTATPLLGTVIMVNEVMPSWLVLLGSRVSLMNTHHWTHREVSCFRRSLVLPKCGFEYSSEEAFLKGSWTTTKSPRTVLISGLSVFCRYCQA